MRIAIIGAGATGGFLGGRLARAGEDVVLVARGPHLEAMRSRGLRLIEAEGEYLTHPEVTDDLSATASADVVFLTVKAHSLPGLAPRLGAALRSRTSVVSAQNGIPWWYFERHGGTLEGTPIRSVDPDGTIARHLDAGHLIGSVVWPATRIEVPGVVRHVEGTRFTIGELDGERSERCQAISESLGRAGLKCPISRAIRQDIWLKLLGNVAFNPISALTRATMDRIAGTPETRAVARAVMQEAESVARALGITLPISVDQRLAGAEKVGAHKTSMLQDVEARRPLELGPVIGAVVELGELTGVAVPHLQTLYGCIRLLDQTMQEEG